MSEIDTVIRNGTVVDGTGAARFRAVVAIAGDRIVALGAIGRAAGAREIDAAGQIVAPGFIDAHTHDDRALLSMPDMTPKVSQGVTSVVAGNCGAGLAPLALDGIPPAPLDLLGSEAGWFRFGRFGEYAEALRDAPPALNCGLLVGHITLRHRVMDRFDRPARAGEIAEMRRQVGTAMVEGAIGLSTGLDYPPAVAAPLDEVVAEWHCTAFEAAKRLLPAGAIYFQLDEGDVRAILAYEHTMIGSDGLPHDVHPHPRLWGTFPRVLGHYCREAGLFSLEEAVRRMTSLPARWFGFRDRGVVRTGAFADLVVFDAETVRDCASFTDPAQPAAGIALVVVNGRAVWQDGRHTGGRPGRVLTREV